MALVVQIAVLHGIPPFFMVAIAELESDWQPKAMHINDNGTVDQGLMQLNSSWYIEDNWDDPTGNITAAAEYIVRLRSTGINWYQTAIAYNCGIQGLRNGPPPSAVDYAVRVFSVWEQYDKTFTRYVGQ
jgi:soluble lytic murein transglycosylase-like protein